ncbi:hypothetical protein HY489_04040 [Candidatus Woesearchaeota archaeon]|nr:hypothetical protein [Candidatus Woesearchaeota archaeon]
MRLLEGADLETAVSWMAFAAVEAEDSSCRKAKRGVVLVRGGGCLLGRVITLLLVGLRVSQGIVSLVVQVMLCMLR